MGEPLQTDYDFRGSGKVILALALLLPLTYFAHVAEEYWVGEGYPAYLYRIRGVHLSVARFWISQSVGTILMIIGILIAYRMQFLRVMLCILGAIVLINGITHSATAFMKGDYGPGLYSSILLWIPLGLFTLFYFRNRIIRWKFWMAIGIGLAVNVVIDIFTMRGAKF